MPAKLTITSLLRELKALGNREVAEHARGFFKTDKGEYGEGDKFLGIRMPVLRQQVIRLRDHSLTDITTILHSSWHEVRMLALLALVDHYHRGDEKQREAVVRCYLDNLAWINNWDLVDCSAHKILGPWFQHRSRKPLYRMAQSPDLWERRIAIMSTFHFIRFSGEKDVAITLKLAEMLLTDKEDLIHKAVGWMLREAGKFQPGMAQDFLDKHNMQMPRTMLRYAIEKLPEKQRQAYLRGKS